MPRRGLVGKKAVVRVGLYRHADGGGGGGKAASQWRGDEGVGGVVRATAAGGDEVGRRRELALVSGLRLCQGARASPVRRSIAISVSSCRALACHLR